MSEFEFVHKKIDPVTVLLHLFLSSLASEALLPALVVLGYADRRKRPKGAS